MYLNTKEEEREFRQIAISNLIESVGGPAHLAKMIGVPNSTVNSWLQRGAISMGGRTIISNHPRLRRWSSAYLDGKLPKETYK